LDMVQQGPCCSHRLSLNQQKCSKLNMNMID
jgi:hypothetical protein